MYGNDYNIYPNPYAIELYVLEERGDPHYLDKHNINYFRIAGAFNSLQDNYLSKTLKNQINGYAGLDADCHVPEAHLPWPLDVYVRRDECEILDDDGKMVDSPWGGAVPTNFANANAVQSTRERNITYAGLEQGPWGICCLYDFLLPLTAPTQPMTEPTWDPETVTHEEVEEYLDGGTMGEQVILHWSLADCAGGFPRIHFDTHKIDDQWIPWPNLSEYQHRYRYDQYGGYCPLDGDGRVPMANLNMQAIRIALGLFRRVI